MSRILVSLEIPTMLPWNARSAVANVVSSFCEVLQESGHDVYINQYPFSDVLAMRRQGVMGDRTRKASRFIRFFPKRFREFVKDIQLFYLLRKQYAVVRNIPRPDIIISWVSYGSTLGADLSQYWKVPLYSIYDNPLCEEYCIAMGFPSFFSRYVDSCEKKMLQASKGIIVYSHAVSDYLRSKYSLSASFFYKQFVDYYKTTNSVPQSPDTLFNFIYIGSFLNWHQLQYLLQAFRRLADRKKGLRLYLVGKGTEYEHIKEFSDSLGLQELVIFTGYADDEKLTNILRIADVAIIPGALWFHAPVKLFQYAANGLPILSVRTPTIEEITTGTGSIRLFDHHQQMESAMEEMLLQRKPQRERALSLIDWFNAHYSRQALASFFEDMFRSEKPSVSTDKV